MAASTHSVRAGLVGYGGAGERLHAPLIEATDGIELVAISTADPERARRARAAHAEATIVESATALIAAGPSLGLDLVVVAAPNRAHVPVALAALEAGYGVVVDKPLATTAAGGRQVVAEAEARGLLLSVFQNRRWDGDFLTVRRLVGEGALGQVLRLESRFERWRPEPPPGAWRERADPLEGGGLLLDLGSHLVDQALVLFGPPLTVYAEVGRRRPGAVVDDDTFIALAHAGGVISHLWASALAALPGPRFRALGDRAGYVVYGMDPQEETLTRGEGAGGPGWGVTPPSGWGTLGVGDEVQAWPTEPGDYRRFYQGIVASITDGVAPPVLPAEAVMCLEVLDAARRSATEGQVVRFGPGGG